MATIDQQPSSSGGPKRRFAPIPVETTTRSSRGRSPATEDSNGGLVKGNTTQADLTQRNGGDVSQPRRFVPQPVEMSTRSSRKNLPESDETSTISSRRKDGQLSDSHQDRPKRRFLPQPVETTVRRRGNRRNSHKGDVDVEMEDEDAIDNRTRENSTASPQTRTKLVPEPVETISRRRGNKRNSHREDVEDEEEMADAPSRQSSSGSTSSSVRRFSPELMETLRGSYRQRRTPGTSSPELGKSPTTAGFVYYSPQRSPSQLRAPPPSIHESRFSAANLAKRQQPEKQHSFIVPDLQTIASDSSGESANGSSTATSPTTMSADGKLHRTHRASGDHVEGRLLQLAAEAAERQLREQLYAGFPTEHDYQPVNHYAFDEDDEAMARPGLFLAHGNIPYSRFRRDSAADLDWELSKMRKHQAELEKAERDLQAKAKATGESKFSAAALAARQGIDMNRKEDPAKVVGHWQKGLGLAQMRTAASPPMLGGDIKFPFSLSPKHTRCDVDQAPVPRRHDSEEDEVMEEQSLWSASIPVENNQGTGLWMGTCAQKSTPGTPAPDNYRRCGIMTPSVEGDDPQATGSVKDRFLGMRQLPLTPTTSHEDQPMNIIDRLSKLEQEIEEEFNDAFVTQIYNYISLGYPSLAHDFDEELSKISRIPVEELRKDDQRTDAKGYVGAPEGCGLAEQDVLEGRCTRWVALRLYIREWARQRPEMIERYPSDWGARVRKGSWAI